MIEELKSITDFDGYINGDNPIIVDFYADWCAPCKMLGMVLEEYIEEHKDVTVLRVNVDQYQGLARKYKVLSIPVIKVFQKGDIVKETMGFMRKEELEEFLGSE